MGVTHLPMKSKMWKRSTSPRPSPHFAPPTPQNAESEKHSPLHAKACCGIGRTRFRMIVNVTGCLPLPAGEGLRVRENRPSNLRATSFMETL